MKQREPTSLVVRDGSRGQRVKTPQARMGDAEHDNGVCAGVLEIDLGSAGEEKPAERGANGRFLPGAKAGPRKGAAAKHRASKLARELGLATTMTQPGFAPYLRDARNLARYVLAELAQLNGGHVSSIVGSIIQTGALQLAGSRYLIAKGDMIGGSRLGNDHRSSFVHARHLAAVDGLARKAGGGGALFTLDPAAEAEIAREVDEAMARAKATTRAGNDEVTDREAGHNVGTESDAKQTETEENDE